MNGRSWWVTLIEGIVIVLLGLYLLFGGDAAAGNVILVLALYMLIVGIIALIRGSNDRIGRYQGIIAVIVGALVLFLYAFDILPTYWDFTIFAIGAVLVGLMGLYSEFFDRGGRDFSWGRFLFNALLLLLGVMVFFARIQDFDLQAIIAWILVAMGAIMAVWAFLNRDKNEVVEENPEKVTPKNVEEKIEDTVQDATDEASE
jgi:uncharacterized membrane protein HdeD (DUF308 family)